MKLLLPLALISTLVSCTGIKDPMRPSAEVPRQGAPGTNKVLTAYSKGFGQIATSGQDVTHDTVAYGGKVAVKQARNYTHIGFNAARRSDDLAYRETARYTDYALDTYDDAADLEIRSVKRWPRFASKSAERAFNSSRKMYQSSMNAYGDAVDRTYFSFWNIFNPPETKSWMVGSKNDCIKCCGPFAKVPGGVWTKDFASTTVVETPPAEEDGKGYAGRITK
jgi:hypothetical protein